MTKIIMSDQMLFALVPELADAAGIKIVDSKSDPITPLTPQLATTSRFCAVQDLTQVLKSRSDSEPDREVIDLSGVTPGKWTIEIATGPTSDPFWLIRGNPSGLEEGNGEAKISNPFGPGGEGSDQFRVINPGLTSTETSHEDKVEAASQSAQPNLRLSLVCPNCKHKLSVSSVPGGLGITEEGKKG